MGPYFRSCWTEKKRKLDLTKNELDSFKYCLNVMGRNLRSLDVDTLTWIGEDYIKSTT